MKLLLFPLTILMVVAMLSSFGLGSSSWGNYNLYGSGGYVSDGWYDADGHQVAYPNSTVVSGGEDGYMWLDPSDDTADYLGTYFWINGTSGDFPLYDTSAGANKVIALIGFDTSSSLGLIALVIAIMALVAIVGIKVFGTGEGETSTMTILKGTAFITLWGVFSVMAMGLITQIPLFGSVFYFAITLMYTVGIIQSIGGGGE